MTTAEELKEQQRRMWSEVAPAWESRDAWIAEQTQPLTAWLCAMTRLAPGMQVLDIASGAGQAALAAARLVRPGGTVVATDLSVEMVAVVRRMAAAAQLGNVTAREMDAEKLDFPTDSFDAVICRFGFMFCPDPVQAVAELRRVLKSGGRFALAVWDEPARNPFFGVIAAPLARFNPGPPPDPKAPGPFRLAPPGELAAVLRSGGFSDFQVEARPMTWDYGTVEEYWAIQMDLVAPLKGAVSTMSATDVGHLKAAVLEAVTPYIREGRVRLTATPLCATGRK